jgi:short-subunit dehydrogenase
MAGLVAIPGAAPYNVAKSGVVALSEGLFMELAATGSPVKVSALCPGFVKTALMADQQWTDRLGADPGIGVTPMAQTIDQMFRQGIDDGIDADDVAAEVIDAIRAERFWILTHPEMRHLPAERMQRAQRQENPG